MQDWTTGAGRMEEPREPAAIRIFMDADACPVKTETYRVAERYGLHVYVVANAFIAVPRCDWIKRIIVPEGPDLADDWIAERAGANDIVITADIPLAARCVRAGASVLSPAGKAFTEDFNRHVLGDAQFDDRFALGRRSHAWAAAVLASGRVAIFVRAGFSRCAVTAEIERAALAMTRITRSLRPTGGIVHEGFHLGQHFGIEIAALLATASTSHQVVSACSVTPISPKTIWLSLKIS